MCCDLSEELSYFDLRKEQELRQVFLEFAAAQLARHEKVRGESSILTRAHAVFSDHTTVAREMVCHAVLARRTNLPRASCHPVSVCQQW